MSKQVKRKITVSPSPKSCKTPSAPKVRPSVFERLGTKAEPSSEVCVSWTQTGTCSHGKTCKFSSTHHSTSSSKSHPGKTRELKRKHAGKENAARPESFSSEAPTATESTRLGSADLDLDDADPDDLEQRRIELQRELEKQMKMEKAHKKQKKEAKKESSPSSDSSSSSSEDSSSSSDESSSSSASSLDARRKKAKRAKVRESSSSSDENRAPKKTKSAKVTATAAKSEKTKKSTIKTSKTSARSPSPLKTHKLSQTPPPKVKTLTPSKKSQADSKSPRSSSRCSEKRDKNRTPSPKKTEKPLEKDRKERNDNRERGNERDREKPRLKDDKKREKSPKRLEVRPPSQKKRETPDSAHSRKTASQSRNPSTPTGTSARREPHKNSPSSRRNEKRGDSRCKERDRKDARKSSRERERERERERRFAAREKEREEALARCQERQRERERLKKLQEKEEEAKRAKERARRDDRGLDKPSGDRIERLLPLPQDRIPPGRKECLEKERHARERIRRTPEDRRSRSRKSAEKLDARHYDRGPNREYEREHDRDRDYHLRLREDHRRGDTAYERSRDETRRYAMDVDAHSGHPHGYSDERLGLERAEYSDERRRREMWDEREDIEHRRYREDSRPPTVQGGHYDHDWERQRHLEWEAARDRERAGVADDEWRHYNRSLEGWSGADDRDRSRRWENDNWGRDRDNRDRRDNTRERDTREPRENRDASRPRSSTSQRTESHGETRKEHKPDRAERSDKSSRSQERIDKPPEPAVEEPSMIENTVDEQPVVEIEEKAETAKRPAESPSECLSDAKKLCIADEGLAEDLSDFSDDDADEILNRVEETVEAAQVSDNNVEHVKDEDVHSESVVSSQLPKSPNTNSISKDSMDDNIALDFEEISEDELEEEARMKGLVDALGVDWASLVADSKPLHRPVTSVLSRWESHNVLVNSGVSVELLGKAQVVKIFREHKRAQEQMANEAREKNEYVNGKGGGLKEEGVEDDDDSLISHPIAAMQVIMRQKRALRKNLFANAGPHTRALSARRDLAIRRNLCKLPIQDTYSEPAKSYDPELFKSACLLFQRSL